MNKPRLLDLFCGAGGSAKGYQRAGFYVVGVDIKPQPHYCGDEFIQADALEYISQHGREFDAIHASPPCQHFSTIAKQARVMRPDIYNHPNLIPQTRSAIIETELPYVIENVSGARSSLINPILLCGTMFDLKTKDGAQLWRHRFFECSSFFALTITCQHNRYSPIAVYGGGQNKDYHNPPRKRKTIGVFGHAGGQSIRDGFTEYTTDDRRDAMQIDWMTGDELSEAIPPAYTEFIGNYLIQHLAERITA